MSWKILIERGNLGFSAAHFVTFADDCEPLHGHNYGVRVEAAGELGPESYVLDFAILKQSVRILCKDWDHRFLLPLSNPHLRLNELEDAWEIEYVPTQPPPAPDTPDTPDMPAARSPHHYVLPKLSVVPLPIDNVTAERLAQVLAARIVTDLRTRDLDRTLTRITVGIEETEMQTAFYTLALPEEMPPQRPPGT